MADSLFSFYADVPPDSPLSYEQLQNRRAIAAAAASANAKRPYPTTIGEGIFSGVSDITDAIALNRLDQQSRLFAAQEARQRAALGGLPTSADDAGADTAPPPARPAPAVVRDTAPVPNVTPPPPPPDLTPPAPDLTPPSPDSIQPVAQGDVPVRTQAVVAGAPQVEADAGRIKLARALAKSSMLDKAPIGGGPLATFAPLPATVDWRAVPPTDAGTPPIVTDIPKAPARPAAPPAPPAAPAGTLPSSEQIPAAPEPRAIKSLPEQPPLVPYYRQQQNAFVAMNDPTKSPALRADAKAVFDAWEKQRVLRQEQVTNQYNFDRAQNAQAEEKNRESILGDPAKRVQIEQTAASARKTQQEFEQNQNAFDQIKGPGDETLIRPKGAPLDTPFIHAKGSPAPQLSAQQQEAVNFATTVKPDLAEVDNKLNYGKALTDPLQVGRAGLPLGLGRTLVSQEYRSAQDRLGNFAAAFLKMRSGSAVSPSEAMRTLPSIMPQVGDTDTDLRDKARRRNLITDAAIGASGAEARRVSDEVIAEYERNKPQRVKTIDEIAKLPPGTIFVGPDGIERKAH